MSKKLKKALLKFSQIAHTNKYEEKSPPWASVSANLPPEAFAVVGDKADEKTWLYPHHYVLAGAKPTNEGYPTTGDLMLHAEKLYSEAKKAVADDNKEAMDHFNHHFKAVDPDMDGSFLPNKVGIEAYAEKSVSKFAFSSPAASFGLADVAGAPPSDGSIPVMLIALSGEMIDRPEWGPCVQDIAGMAHASKIVLDYKHDDCELLGYMDSFISTGGNLVLRGRMIPQQTHRRVEEIAANQKAGIPYEASIFFPPSTPDDLQIEFVKAGKTVDVNGKTMTAPEEGLTIFRKWNLRGVAVCPHGADRQTAAYLQGADSGEKITVSIKEEKENTMTEEEKAKLAAEAKAKQDASDKATADATAQAAAKQAADDDADEGDDHDDEEADKDMLKKMGKVAAKYEAKFGKHGADFLKKGMTYGEALEAFADIGRKAMEASDEAEQKAKQSAAAGTPEAVAEAKAKAVKFVQSLAAAESTIDGIPAKFAQRVHDDAAKYGWDAERVKLMLAEAKKLYAKQAENEREEAE
jgi:hypothetical protein